MANEKIVLFDGTSVDKWVKKSSGEPCEWVINDDGSMTSYRGDIVSLETFKDAHIHVEFWLPYMPDMQGQRRANSGVYVQGCYEIQILDTYGKKDLAYDDCGAIYENYPPLVNAAYEPEKWQTYDIYFRAPKFDADGNIVEDAYMTVIFNGVCIHNNVSLPSHTPGGKTEYRVAEGPLMLQDHRCPIRFRNVWFERIDRDSDK